MSVSSSTHRADPAPLHELMSHLLTDKPMASRQTKTVLSGIGTLQHWNRQLEQSPTIDFINYVLRGIGQVIFINNPISGLLILLALFIQSPWVGWMSLLGVLISTITALILGLDRDTIRNGIFGYNGLLVGAALGTFGDPTIGSGTWGWAIAVILFSALTTIMMKTLGVWWAKTVNTPPLTLPFVIATLICLALALWVPQFGLNLGTPAPSAPPSPLAAPPLLAALPIGVGQVFLAGKFLAGLLILLAVAICSPMAAIVALIGCHLGIWAGLMLGVVPDTLYAGLWGYNGVLCALAIGGIFYAPNLRSIVIGGIAAFISALLGGLLGNLFGSSGLPALTLSFCIVTVLGFVVLRRSLPSLVPVALHAITSPEEHRHRYQAAKTVITNFRQQLGRAMTGQRRFYLFDQASTETKGDLRYLFNRIDMDQSSTLSTAELSNHLYQANQVSSDAELSYLFASMDVDGNGSIDFEEFGELMLRHRRLMANYDEFVTYFLPIDADGDDAISLDEMNVAMASVGEPQLSVDESTYLVQQVGDRPMTWNRFIELLLVL